MNFIFFFFPFSCKGLLLSGGHDSLYKVVYISDILPRSVAAREESLHALDIIHYINGVSTHGMTLKEARRVLETYLPKVVLKVTRYVLEANASLYFLSFLRDCMSAWVKHFSGVTTRMVLGGVLLRTGTAKWACIFAIFVLPWSRRLLSTCCALCFLGRQGCVQL